MTGIDRKKAGAWILYDLANTIFSMLVVSQFIVPWIEFDLGRPQILAGIAVSVSMIAVLWTLPFLGRIADGSSRKGFFLRLMTLLCICSTMLIASGGIFFDNTLYIVIVGLVFFTAANYAYQAGLVFYNAFLPEVAPPGRRGSISGWGVAVGYVGSIIGIILINPVYDGTVFSFNVPGIDGWGRGATFFPTALLFLLFALPAFIFLRDTAAPVQTRPEINTRILSFPIAMYIRQAKEYGILRFLVAKFFLQEGVETIIVFMGVYIQAVYNYTQSETLQFSAVVIPAAILGSFLAGKTVDRIGARNTLIGVAAGWILAMGFAVVSSAPWGIWIVGCGVGIFLGSTWTAARPLLIDLSPPDRINECFGLYAMSGKAAAIFGPLVWGGVMLAFESFGDAVRYKAAVGSLLVFMVTGFVILFGVRNVRSGEPEIR